MKELSSIRFAYFLNVYSQPSYYFNSQQSVKATITVTIKMGIDSLIQMISLYQHYQHYFHLNVHVNRPYDCLDKCAPPDLIKLDYSHYYSIEVWPQFMKAGVN